MPTPRPTTAARGYGPTHQATRAAWVPLVEAGQVDCWRCLKNIRPGTPWHLGHDENRTTRGPEHRLCNLQAAAAKTNGTADRMGTPSREW